MLLDDFIIGPQSDELSDTYIPSNEELDSLNVNKDVKARRLPDVSDIDKNTNEKDIEDIIEF